MNRKYESGAKKEAGHEAPALRSPVRGTELNENMNDRQALEILFEVRVELGRNYKQAIRSAWMNGDYIGNGLDKWAGRLQQIRNQFGPSWLADVRPADLAFAHAGGVTFGDINNINRTRE